MPKIRLRLLGVLIGVGMLGLVSCSDAHVTLHPYQMLDLTRPGSPTKVPMADPEMIKVDGTYYLYGTTDAQGFEMWSSKDLSTWTYGGLVWKPTPGSWNDSHGKGGYWAPDVQVAPDGTIWLYYTSKVRIGVAKASSPKGPFVDQLDHPLIGNGYGGVGDGKLTSPEKSIVDNFDDHAWDAWLFTARDGGLFLYFSAMTPFSELRVIPLADHTTPKKVKPTVAVAAQGHTKDDWEGFVREGPAVIEHDGVITLMYSGNAWSNVCYAIGVATATNPLGPFKRDGTVLATNRAKSFFAPGHNGLVDGPNGETLAVFHVKVDGGLFGDRRPMYAPIRFDAEGDLHFVDPPGTTPPHTKLCLEPTL